MQKKITHKNFKSYEVMLYAAFTAYVLIMAVLLFFRSGSRQTLNLIPFKTINGYLSNGGAFSFTNLAGNVVMFVPLGVYAALFSRRSFVILHTLAAITISAAVECAQYLLRVGAADIDDVILNGLGGFIGALLFTVLRLIFKDKVRNVTGLVSFIMAVVFIVFLICMYSGALGFKIRIL